MKKIILKLFCTIWLTVLFGICTLTAQSIRKDHNEMTASEKANYVNAMYIVGTNPDVIVDLAVYHNDNFIDIHFNLPSNAQNDVFFPFHRMMLFELEQNIQNVNENLSIPYWNWVVDNTNTSTLWNYNFMGQFDTAWNLDRAVGLSGFPLPNQFQIDQAQAHTNFLQYVDYVERGIVHTGGHSFIGGMMNTGYAPIDPVFHLHHCMVDKLWDDWETVNQSSSFIRTTIPRYDGTYVYNGITLPSINPNNIKKAKDLGVFYAENQFVKLEDYTVSNTYRPLENFYYQYYIDCGDNFNVPPNRRAKIESVRQIDLLPGFDATYGSVFTAKIDEDDNVATPVLSNTITNDAKASPPVLPQAKIKRNVYLKNK